MKAAWLVCAVLVACKHEQATQSFADALGTICNAPADATAEYWKTHLANPEAIDLLAKLTHENPAQRQQRMMDALGKAHLTSCTSYERSLTSGFTHVPVVPAAPGTIDLDRTSPVVAADTKAITVEGKQLVVLEHGALAAKDLDGIGIAPLQHYLQPLAAELQRKGALPRLVLALDPTLPYSLLVAAISSGKKSGWRQFGIVVRVGADPRIIPIDLPDAAQVAPGAPIGMALTIKAEELDLWSTSGTEGTLQQPIAAALKPATIATALGEVVTRHWPTGTARPAGTQTIIVTSDETVPLQRLADVLVAIRATDDGHALFPDVQLAVTR